MTDEIVQDQAKSLRKQMEIHRDEEIKRLPSRKEYHKHKRKKMKVKITFPIIRLLLMLFLLLVIVLVTSPYWMN
ncbi:hypothetical protein [Halalkalibacter urbisdiaboli]|uniref:hypothetical protein n=1 Tax=Halalkalibacter urbisdiaboli TaxID=1960589 RepID=UPI000B436605|nr:hypothetical protein [Halalkalibacter urbisdiaboli]